jgi:ankyrin repeat protein
MQRLFILLLASQVVACTSELHDAAAAGDIATLKTLIASGRSVDEQATFLGATPLMEAARNGQVETMRYLVANGADPHAKSDIDATTIGYAAQWGELKAVDYLIELGVDVNVWAEQGGNPLVSASGWRLKHIRQIVKMRNIRRPELNWGLLGGIDSIQAEARRAMEAPVNIDVDSIRQDFQQVVRSLIAAGADVNTRQGNRVAILAATKEGHVEIVRLLVEAGADVNTKTKWGKTPLTYAAQRGLVDLVELLIQKGAEINVISRNDWTPLI